MSPPCSETSVSAPVTDRYCNSPCETGTTPKPACRRPKHATSMRAGSSIETATGFDGSSSERAKWPAAAMIASQHAIGLHAVRLDDSGMGRRGIGPEQNRIDDLH